MPAFRLPSRRAACGALAVAALLVASPALAQNYGGIDSLNATNERLSNRSQLRSIEQRQQFDTNQTRMQIQRSDTFRPSTPAAPIVVPGRR